MATPHGYTNRIHQTKETEMDIQADPLPWFCEAGDHRCPDHLMESTSGQGYGTHPTTHEWVYAPRPAAVIAPLYAGRSVAI